MSFNEWLQEKLVEKGWSYSELARRGGTSHARISQVLNSNEQPGADFCVKIARALGESPEHVLRLAGFLDPLPESKEPDVNHMIKDIWLILKRAQSPDWAPTYIPTEQKFTSPSLEDIMDVLQGLDALETQNVYNYARWRLREQQRRRDSSNLPQRSEDDQAIIARLEKALEKLSSDEREIVLNWALEYRTKWVGERPDVPNGE